MGSLGEWGGKLRWYPGIRRKAKVCLDKQKLEARVGPDR